MCPLPSLYRHVKKLHNAGLVVVAATRSINGIEERFYTAVQGLIDPDALDKPESMDAFAEHVSVYGMVVAQAAAQHIAQRSAPDLNNLAVRDHFFYATERVPSLARSHLRLVGSSCGATTRAWSGQAALVRSRSSVDGKS
jgi:hypothetical protein